MSQFVTTSQSVASLGSEAPFVQNVYGERYVVSRAEPLVATENSATVSDGKFSALFAGGDVKGNAENEVFSQFAAKDKWTSRDEKRFGELAALEAIEESSEDDIEELEKLVRLRRRLKSPTTLEEHLHRLKRQKLEHELLSALDRYVRFK